MNVAVLGSSGRFGSFVSEYLRSRGNSVCSFDLDTSCTNPAESILSSDISILATPLKETLSFVEEYSEVAQLVEICSVKAPFRKYSGKVLSIHPFFGPESYKDAARRKIALITDISPVKSESIVKKLFPDCSVVKMDSEKHDRIMAQEQGLPYLISLFFTEYERSIEPFTGSGKMLTEMLKLPDRESIRVMKDSIAENPEMGILLSDLNEFFRHIGTGGK